MRFNAKELWAVATQPSYKFDKEGILILKEKKEGIFRRSDAFSHRWCRLRGNLLFYFKTKDQYSEPCGVFVLEDFKITIETDDIPFSFSLTFTNDEQKQQFSAISEIERDSWCDVLSNASFSCMCKKLSTLQNKLKQRESDVKREPASKRHRSFTTISGYDPLQFEPFLELNLCCDNLKCDGDGHPPSSIVCISFNNPPLTIWTKFAQTEIVEKCSNPCFLTTATFVKGEVSEITRVKLAVYDVREPFAFTSTLIGETVFTLDTLLQSQHHSLRLTLLSPCCTSAGFITVSAREVNNTQNRNAWLLLAEEDSLWSKVERPRSYSLPTRLSSQIGLPVLGQLRTMSSNFTTQTYRFHTGLGAELHVHEIMAESKLSILIPCMLLNLWINEEKMLMDKILHLGELSPEWRQKQLAAAESHLHLINQYTETLDFLSMQKNCTFKPSILKKNINFEFVPVNLHLQRMWVQNVTTRKTGTYDFITVGIFSSYSRNFKQGGLLRLLNNLKSYCTYASKDNGSAILGPDPISRATEAIRRIDQLQEEIEKDVQLLIIQCDLRSSTSAQSVLNSLSSKGNQLMHVCIPELVEDMLILWESVKLNKQSIHNAMLHTPKTEKTTCTNINKGNEIDGYYNCELEKKSINIDGKEQITDLQYLHLKCICTDNDLSNQILKENVIYKAPDISSAESVPDELEPLDLTHLNIKASIMCMASKIQSFVQSSQPSTNVQVNNSSKGQIADWTNELMPSIRKLRQAVSHLAETASLTYSIICMKESSTFLTVNQEVRHRRDIVFSQALTSLVTGLMTRIWCQNPDAMFIYMLRTVGVFVHFEGLLSCHGNEIGALEDMVVGVDDLRRVIFWLEPATSPSNPQPRIEGSRLFLSVVIPAPQSVIALLPKESSRGCHFSVCSIFFNIGINEKATIAEKLGTTSLEDKINLDSFNLLMDHFSRFQRVAKEVRNQGFRFSESYIVGLLEQLQKQISARKSKNVEILHIASEICRHLGGIRFTSCKSAKDRTGMSVTLEQTMVLIRDFNLDEKEMPKVLDCMRSEGTRRENTLKNVGVRKYFFSSFQKAALPKLYQPPPGTYGNKLK